MHHSKIEVLAPAGSMESLIAAIAAGADAVYVGGNQFGARAFAQNFTQQQLLDAIDYVHVHGCKLFLTVNTLLKDSEICEELYDYLLPYYEHGLDAVIVQDVGVLEFVKTYFPDIDIHVSTQMTVTNASGAKFFKEKGVTRVVTSRELNVDEIKEIADETGLEIESFVHGALCYCYSGQCLFSSLIGGRSGNRGQCAQPCRLPYEVKENREKGYLISLKDICTLDYIPDLVECGIYSFKIEGRMKKPEYVAAVTSMYRKYVDLYFAVGRERFSVDPADKQMLLDIYNRGGFDSGYYHKHNGAEMISRKRSNHAGVPVAKVISQKGRELTVRFLRQVNKGDILELSENKDNYTLGSNQKKGDTFTLIATKGLRFEKGTVISRVRNQKVLDEIDELYIHQKYQQPMKGWLNLTEGKEAVLTLESNGVTTLISGEIVDTAKNQPLDEVRIRKQLNKTGNSEFCFAELTVTLSGNVFVPMQQINELRRNAMESHYAQICSQFYRNVEQDKYRNTCIQLNNHVANKKHDIHEFYCSVDTWEQFEVVSKDTSVSRIYMDSTLFLSEKNQKERLKQLQSIKKSGEKELYLSMPRIFRKQNIRLFHSMIREELLSVFDGVLLRNFESFEYLRDRNYEKPMVLDQNMYVMNAYARRFWKQENVSNFTTSVELNQFELEKMDLSENGTMIVYGYLPMMVSAQCINRTTNGCNHESGKLTLKDRYQKEFLVKNFCDYCYNIIYNSDPLYLADKWNEIEKISPSALRLDFTMESNRQVEEILVIYKSWFIHHSSKVNFEGDFTRGHFNRGIK